MDVKKLLAEVLGTFVFLSIGFASVPAAIAAGVTPYLVVPFSFGLGLLTAIYAFGHVSGGHFNPAVTVAMLLDRRTSSRDAIGYVIAQVVGGILAAALAAALFGREAAAAVVTAPSGPLVGSPFGALTLETVMAAAFVLVILASTRHAPSVAGLVIPLALVAIHFATASLTGASVNPARSIGPALLAGQLGGLWIYLVAPVLGAALAWLVYARLLEGSREAGRGDR